MSHGGERTTLVLSVHPPFAELILSGVKDVELRRTRPAAAAPLSILVYATAPVSALVGVCRLVGLSVGEPDAMWRQASKGAVVERSTYDAYYRGAETAVLWHLSAPRSFPEHIDLEKLRSAWCEFTPPVSFRYVPDASLASLRRVFEEFDGPAPLPGPS